MVFNSKLISILLYSMQNKYSMKLQQSIRSASKLSKSKDINPYDHKLTSSIRHYESEDKFDILVKIG